MGQTISNEEDINLNSLKVNQLELKVELLLVCV